MKTGFVYILSNKSRTTLYIGVTSNLMKRLTEHRAGLGGVFTKKYNVHELLYFEEVQGMLYAIAREKQLKNWHRDWKWNLIKERNPDLLDLAADWFHDKDASY
ncbi:MAG: endonuclease [Bacteroidetes bacterium HGW-Bacteroidetes-6]|nr:MAG: endonuclease [Bacteroidetes bacterium HGW-Bacteroidetes-6]